MNYVRSIGHQLKCGIFLKNILEKKKLSNIEIAVIEDNYIKSVESKDYNLFFNKSKRRRINKEHLISVLEIAGTMVKLLVNINA